MRIHAMSRDEGGCHYYRIRTPLMALRKFGHDVSWGVQLTGEELMNLDVLIVQFLNGEQDLQFLEFVANLPKRPLLVYEVDDDLFSIHEVITREVTKKPVLWGSEDVQGRVKKALGMVDLVTVTTPHLAALYAPYARRVAVLPNAIPDWLLDVEVVQGSKYTIGWTCSHSHLLDAREHFDALLRFMQHTPDARFHWIGPPKVLAFAPWQQRVFPWEKSVVSYLENLGRKGMHVGIAPLGDFPFNQGKSGIKAEEYSALGIPTVASDFPQYRDVIEDGVTGILIRGKAGWGDALRMLKKAPHKREKMGAAAKEAVSGRTISKTCHRWVEAYEGAMT